MVEKKTIEEEFISTLSHEIRTPLTSIKGFSQTMLNSWDVLDDKKKKEFLEIILKQSQRLISLTENVLNVAKLNSNSSDLILTKVNINYLTQNAINMVKISNKDFVFEFLKSKNELYSLCDNNKTQQILLNILDNATKYSKNSNKIEIKTFNTHNYCAISVKNFGNYIDKNDIDKIFDKFYRVSSYINSSAQGSGLGLYIAKNLVEKMQGKIEVQTSRDKLWVEFIVYLPTYEVEAQTKNIGV